MPFLLSWTGQRCRDGVNSPSCWIVETVVWESPSSTRKLCTTKLFCEVQALPPTMDIPLPSLIATPLGVSKSFSRFSVALCNTLPVFVSFSSWPSSFFAPSCWVFCLSVYISPPPHTHTHHHHAYGQDTQIGVATKILICKYNSVKQKATKCAMWLCMASDKFTPHKLGYRPTRFTSGRME